MAVKAKIKKFYEPDIKRLKKLVREGKLDPDIYAYIKEKVGKNPKSKMKVINCKTCKQEIARFRRSAYPAHHVPKEKILETIRDHYKAKHPEKFKKFAEKAVKTKREKGIINKKGQKVGKGKKKGKKKKKWGKIGAPDSKKRTRFLAKIRKKR